MPMTVLITRNVPMRFRGFLASCMLEVAPGIYTNPHMSTGVRDRVWRVMCEWFSATSEASIVMVWSDRNVSGGQGLAVLGEPPRRIVDYDGIILSRLEE